MMPSATDHGTAKRLAAARPPRRVSVVPGIIVVMLLREVASTSARVGAVPGRLAKVAELAGCLAAAARTGDRQVVAVVVHFLAGELRQRRTGIGWATLAAAPAPGSVAGPPLTVLEVDAAFGRAESLAGPGSQSARAALAHELMGRADPDEARLLAGLVSGELRQGAQTGLLLDAVARAAGAPVDRVRRALTVSGSLPAVATEVLLDGPQALDRFALEVGRGLSPMLAKTAPDVATAVTQLAPAAVEWKLDGIRIQVHRSGEEVRVFTRTLDEVSARLPEVVAWARSLPGHDAVLDAEAIALHPDGRPLPFQRTAARVGTRDGAGAAGRTPLSVFAFDVLALDGTDLTERPLAERRRVLEQVAPDVTVPRVVVTPDAGGVAEAERFAADALARGHEGVVVKALDSSYAMGRRGAGWVKVKPVHTLDLVVLAAEWGHGRRTGRLSNLHLGALDPDGRFGPAGGFVMLGKTFKGLTDELLAWQTERFTELADGPLDRAVVRLRPEQVVEIALDGVQTSPRYPAGVALRFARVLRYRPDKTPDQADTVQAVLDLRP